MRRYLSILIVFIILVSAFVIPAGAVGYKRFEHDAVIPGGQDIGFYDTSGQNRIESQTNGSSCIRAGEWYKFSLAGLDKGIYNLYITAGHKNLVTFSVMLNDEVVLENASKAPTDDYYNFVDGCIGQIEIKEIGSILTIKNTCGNAAYWTGFYLEAADYAEGYKKVESKQQAYAMSELPCVIEAEDFDCGLQGIDFYSVTNANKLGAYRPYAKMNIDDNGKKGYSVSLDNNEWCKYTFKVSKSANYELKINAKQLMPESKIRAYIDSYEVLPHQSLSENGNYKEYSAGVFKLEAGTHVLAIKCIEGNAMVDYSRFAYSKKEGKEISEASGLRKWADTQVSEYIEPIDEEDDARIMREIYVSANVNKNGTGSKDDPFNSIESAKALIRKINDNMTGNIVVNLEGTFYINEPIVLDTEDSGSNGFKVVWKGDGNTVISGGQKLEGFTKVEGTPFYMTKVESEGFRQLYVNNNRAFMARSKYMYQRKEIFYDPENPGATNAASGLIMKKKDAPAPLTMGVGAELVIKPSWMAQYLPIDKMYENEDGDYVISFTQPLLDAHSRAFGGDLNTDRFYFQNAPELLDEPGEYYFNKKTKELFYYPLETDDMATADVHIPKSEGLLYINGTAEQFVSDITVTGIKFMYGGWEHPTERGFSVQQGDKYYDPYEKTDEYSGTYYSDMVPGQLQTNYAKNIDISHNRFAHLGSGAVHINNASTNVTVRGNLFDDIGAAAVVVGTYKVPKQAPVSELVNNVKVTNNLIRRVAVDYGSSSAISAYFVNNVDIAHNDIYDTPYSGITFGWGWGDDRVNCGDIRVMYNKIVNVCTTLFDGAHVYTLGKMPGSLIANNYMYYSGDTRGGLYLDNSSQEITYKNNVCEETWNAICCTSAAQYNKMNNTAINNYCELPNNTDGNDINNFEEAKGKVNGEWPQEAKDIIARAGLTSQYAHLLAEYEKFEGENPSLRNNSQILPKHCQRDGMIIDAGDVPKAAKDIYWHDSKEFCSAGIGMDGTGLIRVMTTLQGEWTKYDFEIEEAGYYDFIMNASTSNDNSYGEKTRVDIELDGKLIADKAPLNLTGHYFTFTETNMAKRVYLEKGMHTMKITHAVNNFGFSYTRIVKSEIEEKNIENRDEYNYEYLKKILK